MHAALREKLAQMNTCAQENISGNRVVKAFAREDYEIEKFDRANTDYAETNKATGMVWLKFFPDCREYCEPDAGCPARSRRCFL